MNAAIYTQKNDLDTFLYLSRFISELDKRGVKAILFSGTAKSMQFSKEFETFSNKEDLKLKKAGCLFQLNLLSVVGYYGNEIAKIAEKLLQKSMYDFVGSDVHHANHIAAFDQNIKLKDPLPLKEAIANNQFFQKE